MSPTDAELAALSVHELTVRVSAAAGDVLVAANELLANAPVNAPDRAVALSLFYVVLEPRSQIRRRADYVKDMTLESTGHLRYEARAILSDAPWQSKVGAMVDFVEELDRIMEKARSDR